MTMLRAAMILGLAVASDAVSANDRIGALGETMWAEAEFRARYPEPANLAETRELWKTIESRFNEAARDGASAHVVVSPGSGQSEGTDHYVLAKPPRLRELREGMEVIAEGDRYCSRTPPAGPWACGTSQIRHGLTAVDWDAVIDASIEVIDCAPTRCVRVSLQSASAMDVSFEGGRERLFARDPSRSFRRIELVATLPDHRLLRSRLTEVSPWPSAGDVIHTYDVDAEIPPIVLPD